MYDASDCRQMLKVRDHTVRSGSTIWSKTHFLQKIFTQDKWIYAKINVRYLYLFDDYHCFGRWHKVAIDDEQAAEFKWMW